MERYPTLVRTSIIRLKMWCFSTEKLEQAESQLAHLGRMGGFFMPVQKKKEVCFSEA
jgi:hypothetical protein